MIGERFLESERMRLKRGKDHFNEDSSFTRYVEDGKRGLVRDLETSWSLEALVKRLLVYCLGHIPRILIVNYCLWSHEHRGLGN